MRRIDVGNWQVFALTDCAPAPATCAYAFPDADLSAELETASRWFPDGMFHTRFGAFLLRGAGGDVLVDCGVGPGPHAYFPGLRGQLDDALADAGSGFDRVAAVVFTHLHLDHVGWAPHVPRARFLVGATEWDHWSGGGAAAGLPHHVAAVASRVAPLATSGRLERIAPDSDPPWPGLTLLAAPGHTPGHSAVLVGDRLLIAGDTWHAPAQIEVASWCHRADHDKTRAMATRAGIAAEAEHANWIVAAGHFPEESCFGTISGRQFRPLSA